MKIDTSFKGNVKSAVRLYVIMLCGFVLLCLAAIAVQGM